MSPVMIVTGASRGIGAATARRAAEAGYDVAVNYLKDAAAAERVAADIRASGRRAAVIQADMAEPAAIEQLFDRTDAELGRLSVLVNNAGIVTPKARVDEMAPDRLDRILRLNVTSCFLAAGAAVRRMSTARGGAGGVIVNLSSAAARLGGAGVYVDYAASKAAIEALTVGLAHEVGGEGIRVVGLRPGVIETEIHADTGIPGRFAAIATANPLGRPGRAEEIAEAIVWLAGDGAGYVTGTLLDVTGGR